MFQSDLDLRESADERLEMIERYFEPDRDEIAFDDDYWARYEQLIIF